MPPTSQELGLVVAMAAALGGMVQTGPMLRQLLVGATVSVCNIAIHALVMTLVVEIIVATCAREAHNAAIATIDEARRLNAPRAEF